MKSKKTKGQESGKKQPAAPPADPNVLKTQREVAERFAVTTRTVQYWIKEGLPVTPEGHFLIDAVEQWQAVREAARKKSPSEDLNREDARLRRARADKVEMELAKLRGELISLEEVERGRVMRVETIKKALLSLPKRLAPQVAGTDVKTAMSIIDKRIREIIEDFAKG